MCNPKKYLKFNFTFIAKVNGKPKEQDLVKIWERMVWLSQDTYVNMLYTYRTDKSKWFEIIDIQKLNIKVPNKFRDVFPSETSDKFAILRVYPAGIPNGSKNPRIIGMIKNTIFYVFYLDWDGTMYEH